MSVLITANAADAVSAAATERRTVVRRRVSWGISSMVMLCGMAAVPMPARSERDSREGEISELGTTIEAAEAELQTLSTWDKEGHDELSRRVQRWFGHADVLDLRNELLATAAACGLDVRSLDIAEDVDPLDEGAGSGASASVLGASPTDEEEIPEFSEATADLAGEGDPSAPPQAILAVRFTLKGTGPMSSFMIFVGLLPHLPHPMRLRSAKLTSEQSTPSFVVQVDKLLGPLSVTAPLQSEVGA